MSGERVRETETDEIQLYFMSVFEEKTKKKSTVLTLQIEFSAAC